MANTILRVPAAQTQSGYSRSTIYLRITQGLWPRQISLGPRAIGWPSNEIEALNAARISGKTDAQIRELVESLHTKRKELMAAWGLTHSAQSRSIKKQAAQHDRAARQRHATASWCLAIAVLRIGH